MHKTHTTALMTEYTETNLNTAAGSAPGADITDTPMTYASVTASGLAAVNNEDIGSPSNMQTHFDDSQVQADTSTDASPMRSDQAQNLQSQTSFGMASANRARTSRPQTKKTWADELNDAEDTDDGQVDIDSDRADVEIDAAPVLQDFGQLKGALGTTTFGLGKSGTSGFNHRNSTNRQFISADEIVDFAALDEAIEEEDTLKRNQTSVGAEEMEIEDLTSPTTPSISTPSNPPFGRKPFLAAAGRQKLNLSAPVALPLSGRSSNAQAGKKDAAGHQTPNDRADAGNHDQPTVHSDAEHQTPNDRADAEMDDQPTVHSDPVSEPEARTPPRGSSANLTGTEEVQMQGTETSEALNNGRDDAMSDVSSVAPPPSEWISTKAPAGNSLAQVNSASESNGLRRHTMYASTWHGSGYDVRVAHWKTMGPLIEAYYAKTSDLTDALMSSVKSKLGDMQNASFLAFNAVRAISVELMPIDILHVAAAVNKHFFPHGSTDKITKKPKIMVLNCGDPHKAGGKVDQGHAGPEESLAVRTTMIPSLAAADLYNSVSDDDGKPCLASDEFIYSPKVRVIYLDPHEQLSPDKKFDIGIITMPAVSSPKLEEGFWADIGDRQVMEHKIEVILHHAAQNGVEYLILPAFGCGAEENPPHLVADMFAEAIFGHDDWPWSRTSLKKIIFAIEDTSDGQITWSAFKESFAGRPGVDVDEFLRTYSTYTLGRF